MCSSFLPYLAWRGCNLLFTRHAIALRPWVGQPYRFLFVRFFLLPVLVRMYLGVDARDGDYNRAFACLIQEVCVHFCPVPCLEGCTRQVNYTSYDITRHFWMGQSQRCHFCPRIPESIRVSMSLVTSICGLQFLRFVYDTPSRAYIVGIRFIAPGCE